MSSAWQLQPIFDSYGLVLVLAAGLLLLAWWGTRHSRLTDVRRGRLRLIRLLWLVGLCLLMLRPTLVYEQRERHQRTVAVMVDQSLSMATADVDGGKRWDAVRTALARVWPTLQDLSDQLHVEFYRFDQRASAVEEPDLMSVMQGEPTGVETDLGSSLQDILQQQLEEPLVAVIMASDGAQRVVRPRVDLFEAARQLQRLGIPLYTTPFGQASDPADTRDVALQELPDQFRVFVKTAWNLTGTVEIHGFVNQAMPVHVVLEGEDESRVELPVQEVTAGPGQHSVPYQFTYVPEKPGQYKVTVSVPTQLGETIAENNQLVSYLTVLDGGIRVLLLESNWLAPESKFRRRALGSAPAFELDELLIDWRKPFPQPLTREGELADYDVVVIGDVHAEALSNEDWKRLADLVEQGGGLIMTGGVHAFGAGGYAQTVLADVLPVEVNRLEGQRPQATISLEPDLQLPPPVAMLPTTDHFVTRLGLGEKNRAVWLSLPPLNGAYRFSKLKPAAFRLAATDDGVPLLVAGQYGLGRVLAFAGDSTYRWWLHGHAEHHQRFWRQVVLWLANKEDLSRNELLVHLERRRVMAGTEVGLEVSVRNEAGQLLPETPVTVELQGPSGKSTPVRLRRRADGWGADLSQLTELGDYRVVATAELAGTTLTDQAKFVVFRQDWERMDPAANPDQLRRLADLTREAGGRLVAAEELASVLQEIADRPLQEPVRSQQRWQFGDTWFDALLSWVVLSAAMAGEWYLRKRWGLV